MNGRHRPALSLVPAVTICGGTFYDDRTTTLRAVAHPSETAKSSVVLLVIRSRRKSGDDADKDRCRLQRRGSRRCTALEALKRGCRAVVRRVADQWRPASSAGRPCRSFGGALFVQPTAQRWPRSRGHRVPMEKHVPASTATSRGSPRHGLQATSRCHHPIPLTLRPALHEMVVLVFQRTAVSSG